MGSSANMAQALSKDEHEVINEESVINSSNKSSSQMSATAKRGDSNIEVQLVDNLANRDSGNVSPSNLNPVLPPQNEEHMQQPPLAIRRVRRSSA